MTFTPFTPAVGLQVEFRGHIGEIGFIDEEYLTICLKRREGNMIGDVCMLAYRAYWNEIQILGGHHKV